MSEAAPSRIDYSAWPIVHFHRPERVSDAQALAQVAEFESLLARGERFVLMTSGPMMPAKSRHFMTLYGDWSRKSQSRMGALCAGSVRIEADALKRAAFLALSKTFMSRNSVPYPVAAVASEAEARTKAAAWLTT